MPNVELKWLHLQVVDPIVGAIAEIVAEGNLEMFRLHLHSIASHFAQLDHLLQFSLALSTQLYHLQFQECIPVQSIRFFISEARVVNFYEVFGQEIKWHHLVLLKQEKVDFAHSDLILRHFYYGSLALRYLAKVLGV